MFRLFQWHDVALVVLAVSLFVLNSLSQYGKERITASTPRGADTDEQSSDSDSDNEKGDSTKAHMNGNGSTNLIERQTKIHTTRRTIPNVRSLETMRSEFQLDDAMYYCKTGIEVSHITL